MSWTVRPRLGALALVVLSLVSAGAGCDEGQVRVTLPPGALVDVFQQVNVSKVDVLFVIDNSGSMVEEQENLSRNLDRFMEYMTVAKIDYHIGVTTTDVLTDPGKLVGSPQVITPATPKPLDAMKRNVKVGVGGNAREAGLDAARRLLDRRPADFWRSDAFLFLVFVSDEEDNSEPGTPKFFYRYFEGLKGKGNESMISAGAIVGDVPNGCSSAAGKANPGSRYKDVVEKVGGRLGSICNAEFDKILKEMGVDAVGLRRKFPLTKFPDLSTMDLTVRLPCDTDPALLARACSSTENLCGTDDVIACKSKAKGDGEDGWTVESGTNTLVFAGAAIPPKGSSVEAIYFEQDKAPTP